MQSITGSAGGGLLVQKMAAIANCIQMDVGVVLVPTLIPGVNTENIGDIIRLALAQMPTVRGGAFPAPQLFWTISGATVRLIPHHSAGSHYRPSKFR